MRTFNLSKEQYRGTVKQLMKIRGLRKINLDNYFRFKGSENMTGVHSVRLDLQDGYVNLFGYDNKNRCGEEIEDATPEMYGNVYNTVLEIFQTEPTIPFNTRRNILVNLCR